MRLLRLAPRGVIAIPERGFRAMVVIAT